jgi:hypothetical protein
LLVLISFKQICNNEACKPWYLMKYHMASFNMTRQTLWEICYFYFSTWWNLKPMLDEVIKMLKCCSTPLWFNNAECDNNKHNRYYDRLWKRLGFLAKILISQFTYQTYHSINHLCQCYMKWQNNLKTVVPHCDIMLRNVHTHKYKSC